jgi:NitT/TauT family transport system permease protein
MTKSSQAGEGGGLGVESAETQIISLRSRVGSALGTSPVLFLASMALLVGIWYLLILVFRLQPFVLPPPHVVFRQMVNHWPTLLAHSRVTMIEILAGFGVAVAVGFPLGMLIAFSRVMDRLLYPPLVVSQAVPKIALAPVFLAWFGFGFRTNVAISFLVAVFPVIINTALGLKSLDPDMVRLGKAMGSNQRRLFFKIRLPAAMPAVFAGLKIAITFAVVGAVVGEFVAGSAGLGYAIQVATGLFNMSLAFAAIVAISVLGVVAFFAVELLERIVLRSHPHEQRA